MKIASFNINDVNRRLTNLLNWLREAEPDIVCLQELKWTWGFRRNQSGRRVVMRYGAAKGAGTARRFLRDGRPC